LSQKAILREDQKNDKKQEY